MGYWGKRQALAAFMSVWVVGCSSTHETAPTMSPTSTPALTLVALNASATSPPSPLEAPSATPAPPPTMIAYAIQPGDTLLGIARQFGVPVATLEAVNTGLNPLALPIGATLVIPAPLFDATGRPILPSATPSALQADPPLCLPTATGTILCLGQITNRLPQTVERVTFVVRLVGRDGNLLAEAQAGLEQVLIPPEASAPYRALLAADWQQVAGSGVTLRSADFQPPDSRYFPLRIESESVSLASGQYTVLARVRAPATGGARLVRAVLALYDGRGRVIGFRSLSLDAHLEAGESFTLRATSAVLVGETVRHTLYVEGERIAH
jgi:LysM repeat protein